MNAYFFRQINPSFKSINDQLYKLPGFESFEKQDIWMYLDDPMCFSIQFKKEKGQGFLYGMRLASMRRQLFNVLKQKDRINLFFLKIKHLLLLDSLSTFLAFDDFKLDYIKDVKDIGMGHSVYWVLLHTGKEIVLKETDHKHPEFYSTILSQLNFPSISSFSIKIALVFGLYLIICLVIICLII